MKQIVTFNVRQAANSTALTLAVHGLQENMLPHMQLDFAETLTRLTNILAHNGIHMNDLYEGKSLENNETFGRAYRALKTQFISEGRYCETRAPDQHR